MLVKMHHCENEFKFTRTGFSGASKSAPTKSVTGNLPLGHAAGLELSPLAAVDAILAACTTSVFIFEAQSCR